MSSLPSMPYAALMNFGDVLKMVPSSEQVIANCRSVRKFRDAKRGCPKVPEGQRLTQKSQYRNIREWVRNHAVPNPG